jgi:hypothetical protein
VIRVELYRHEDPDTVLAVATWNDGRPRVEPAEGAPDGVATILRRTPVVVDDASLRSLGSRGDVVLQPGSLEWFRVALSSRGAALGLNVRFVAEDVRNGWDPAANYRTFQEQARRLASS